MTRQPERFLHQHAVDAYAAQHAAENPRPIATTAGLIGLYLFVEKGWTGRRVQRAHMELGNRMKEWPRCRPPPPPARSSPPSSPRRKGASGTTGDEWARAAWSAWTSEHARIRERMEEPYRVRGPSRRTPGG